MDYPRPEMSEAMEGRSQGAMDGTLAGFRAGVICSWAGTGEPGPKVVEQKTEE